MVYLKFSSKCSDRIANPDKLAHYVDNELLLLLTCWWVKLVVLSDKIIFLAY